MSLVFWLFSIYALRRQVGLEVSKYNVTFGSLIYGVAAIHIFGFVSMVLTLLTYLI